MALTGGHLGDIEYIKESSEGEGLPASGSLEVPSDSIISIDLNLNPITERHYTVSDHHAIDTSYHAREYVVTVEYKLQLFNTTVQHLATTALEYYATHRTAAVMDSLAVVYRSGEMYTLLKGAKVNSISWGVAINEVIRMSVELWGTGLETDTAATNFTNYSSLTASASCGGSFEVYGGGAITRSGAFAAGIKSGTFTINNHLERIPAVGSTDTTCIREGHLDPTMSLVILADAGGKNEVDNLLAADETDIVFETGLYSNRSQKLTFTNPSYTSQPVIYRVDDTHMVIGADLQAETVALAAYT